MNSEMHLHYFTTQKDFPFFIQYGHHDENMFLHSHADFSELVFVLGGYATHIVNEEEYSIKHGDVILITANTFHSHKDLHHFRICNIMFQPDYFLRDFSDIKSLPGYHSLFVIEPALTQQNGFQSRLHLSPERFEEFDHMITRIHHEYVSHPAGFQSMTSGLFLQMITSLARIASDDRREPNDNTVSLANTAAYMEYHFREDISIEDLASMSGMSSRHFRRVFHDIYGTSPLKYLHTLRIRSAARLLRSTDLPVTEIAIRSGYPDGNYFSGKFKQLMGMPPLKYRNQHTHEA